MQSLREASQVQDKYRYKTAVTNLTNQLVQQQERLVSKGTSALTDLIKNKKPADTTKKTVLPTTKAEAQEKQKKK
jgi:hypothetical protein